jgi:hypothetical protein
MTRINIFNQYYIDLLKKLKTITKKHKDKSKTAKKTFNTIKENYLTLDKNSDEYTIYINSVLTQELFDSYKNIKLKKEEISDEEDKDYNDLANKWLDDNSELNIFNGITLGEIKKILRDEYVCHHYISMFFILSRDIPDDLVVNIVNMLQKNNYDEELESMEDESDNFKTVLKNLLLIKHKKIKKSIDMNLGGMEDTTLGNLAKEILEEVDINKLQKSIGEDGDILKSIGNPDSGFGDIISSVSQKMATKISNGELNQQNLMQDAMKFASMMPGMFGNQQNNNKPNQKNMGDMMSMFADLMSNKNDNDMPDLNTMRNMAKNMGNKKGTKNAFNEAGYKKIAAQKKLKRKLEARKQEKE